MKPIEQKDKPKLYALVALTVCFLGYAAFTATSGAGSTPPVASSAAKPAPSISPAPGKAPGIIAAVPGNPNDPNAPPIDVADMITKMGPPAGGRDPFYPVGPAAKNGNAPAPNTPPSRVVTTPAPTPAPPLPRKGLDTLLGMDKMQKPSMPGFAVNEVPRPLETPKPVVLAPPPPPDFVVTGVVLSGDDEDKSVAILHGKDTKGGDERRFVVAGDYVGNGFSVASVHADGVDLRDKAGSRHVTLKIGQKETTRAN